MEGRIAYFGQDNLFTAPPCLVQHENGRNYVMPPLGEAWVQPFCWDELVDATQNDIDAQFGHGASVVQNGFVKLAADIPPACSILIIKDLRHREENPFVDPQPGSGKVWMDTVIKGQDRARDLAKLWSRYGVIYFDGPAPSEEHKRTAMGNRRQFANMLVSRAITQYRQGSMGQRGGRVFFTDAEEAWAKEFKIKLPNLTGVDMPFKG